MSDDDVALLPAIRLLGQVEADVAGLPVPLNRRRERQLFAVLALEVNQHIATDRLIDILWADSAPANARSIIHIGMSRLRTALATTAGEHGREWIAHRGDGYQLQLPAETVDVRQFADLCRRADELPDPEHRAELLRQALELWRGPALLGLGPGEPWQAFRTRWDEQRQAALANRIDADLAAGHHTRLVGELTELVAANPLSDRSAGQLMTALSGAGLRHKALEFYRQYRQELAGELGLEPDDRLQQLHTAILRGDRPLVIQQAVRVSPAGPDSEPAAEPQELPAPPAGFVGRMEQLRQLDALVTDTADDQSATVIVPAVLGTAGVGKTSLALRWAHRVKSRFPDGQLFVNLHGYAPGEPVPPIEVLTRFLRSLGVAAQQIPADVPSAAAMFRSRLAGRRMLVVLDNARSAEQVRPLLPGDPGCLALVTSRDRLDGLVALDGARRLTLDVLSPDEAVALLSRMLGEDRTAAEPEAAAELAKLCAFLPLALRIAAAKLPDQIHQPIASQVAALTKHPLADLAVDGDEHAIVRNVLSWSYRQLAVPAARLFRLLGLHPGPDIGLPAAASLASLPAAETQALLTELTHAHLIDEHIPGRYTFHDLLRSFSTEQSRTLDPEPNHEAALLRMLDHYLHTAYNASRCLEPYRPPITIQPPRLGVRPEGLADYDQALAWFGSENQVLLAAITRAAESGQHAHTWQLAWTLPSYFDRHGHGPDSVAAQSIALAAARQAGDPTAQAHARHLLGTAHTWRGEHHAGQAESLQALHLFEQLDDPIGQAGTHMGLTRNCVKQQQYRAGLDHAEHALELYRSADYPAGQAIALNAIGSIHTHLGHHQQALTFARQAIDLHQQLGDHLAEAWAWDSLGHAHHHLSQHQQAVTCYQRALHLCRTLGDRYNQAGTLSRLGDTHYAAKALDQARDAWREALEILEELQHPDAATVRAKLEAQQTAAQPGRGS